MQTCLTKLLVVRAFWLFPHEPALNFEALYPELLSIYNFVSWVTAHGSDRSREWSEARNLLGFSQELRLIQGLRLAPLNIFIMPLLCGPSFPNVFRIFGFHGLFSFRPLLVQDLFCRCMTTFFCVCFFTRFLLFSFFLA